MGSRLVEPLIPRIVRHLDYLVEFLRKSGKERETVSILRTSPYYRWLAYSIIRRELFEDVRTWTDRHMDAEGRLIDRLYDDLIEVWRELKEYGLEGPVRSGIMHEVLYWVASLRAQKQADWMFFYRTHPRRNTSSHTHQETRGRRGRTGGGVSISWGFLHFLGNSQQTSPSGGSGC